MHEHEHVDEDELRMVEDVDEDEDEDVTPPGRCTKAIQNGLRYYRSP